MFNVLKYKEIYNIQILFRRIKHKMWYMNNELCHSSRSKINSTIPNISDRIYISNNRKPEQ